MDSVSSAGSTSNISNSSISESSSDNNNSSLSLAQTTTDQLSQSSTTEESLRSQSTSADQLQDTAQNTDEANEIPAAVIGRSGAAARDSFVNAQTQKAYDIGANTPQQNYNGELMRTTAPGNSTTYSNFTYSDKGGRYNSPGQMSLYTTETFAGAKAESSHYGGINGQTVTTSQFNGSVVDVVGSQQITSQALEEPFGAGGKDRSVLSKITGEDPYQHTRALADGARAQGAEAVRVPANNGHVHVNILPENTRNLPGQLIYTGHQQVDQNGQLGPMQSQPVSPAPDGQSPGKNTSTPDALRSAVDKDLASHSRRGSTVYGGAGSGAVSTISALADGQGISREEAGQIATDTAVGSIAAKADDVLSSRVGNFRGGALIDGVISAGTSTWQNANAVEQGTMSAGDATADVVVDTGVAVSAGVAGMAAGAAVGSIVPVVGTAAGAVIGFGVGMATSWAASATLEGSGIADWAREGLGDVLENNFEKPLDAAWENISAAQDVISDGFSSAGDALSNAGSAISGFVGGFFK